MHHKPSAAMTDRDGDFQRCWECGARRRIAALGPGIWDKGNICGGWEAPPLEARPERTQAELVDELFTPDTFDANRANICPDCRGITITERTPQRLYEGRSLCRCD